MDLGSARSVYDWWSRHPRLFDLFYDLVFLGRESQLRVAAVDALALSPGDRVLELGSGPGNGLERLRERVGAEGRVVGLEASEGMARRAAARVEERGWGNVHVVRADATRPPVREESVDAVYAAMSLTAMGDPVAACEAAHTALRPGGRFAVLDAQPFQTWPLTVLNSLLVPLFRSTTDWVPDADVPGTLDRLFEETTLSTYTDGTLFVAAGRKSPSVSRTLLNGGGSGNGDGEGEADGDGDGDGDGDEDGGTETLTVRPASESDLLGVLRVVEGAMLSVGAMQVRERTERGEVLVADVDGRVVGALVREGDHVEAIAVHPDRRGRGIGTRLVEVALAETGHLTAEFREEVRPFYESLGFDIDEREERLWGERRA